MRYFWLFNLVLCVVLTVASPQGASGKHTVLILPDNPDYCWKFAPQKVTLSPLPITYAFTGTCNLVRTRLALPITVPFTAVGTYDPTNGKTTEEINVPAPKISEPSRPYGRFSASMRCNIDPWLNSKRLNQAPYVDPNVQCDQQVFSATPPGSAYGPGPVGDYARTLIQSITYNYPGRRPYTAWMSDDAKVSLNALYQTSLAAEQKAQQVLEAAKQPSGPYTALIHPSVLTPTAGQILAPQRAVSIKLAPPKGWNVTGYTVNIQRREANGTWVNHTSIPIGAVQAHSLTGYTGFGGGAPPAFLMVPGRWRLNAQASSPKKSGVSDWVEFSAFASADFTAPKRKTPLPF